MPMLFRFMALPLALAASLGAIAETIPLQAAHIKALGIEVRAAGQSGSAASGPYPARVLVPNEQMRLVTAPVAGMVERLAVAPGQSVRRGQIVAHLVSQQALELQRDALQASSQAGLLQHNLKRDEQLYAEGLIAESRFQATRAAASQAAAQASERRQGLALAGVAPGKLGGGLALTAPIDGVVLEQGVQLGQRIETSAMLYRIAKLSPLWLEIQAPLDLAAELRDGMTVRLAGSPLTGRLIAIGRAVDPASQTVLLRASVSAGTETLYPGQVVEVEIDAFPAHRQSLPASALARHQGQVVVFVEQSGNEQGMILEVRRVKLLGQGGDRVVVDGVKSGERIAVSGVSGLKALLAGVGQD